MPPAPLLPASGTYRTRSYVVRWTAAQIDLQTPAGRLLTRWPIGAACSPADPDRPAAPAAQGPVAAPTLSRLRGAPALVWRWRPPAPSPIAEQVETARLMPDRVELQVAVRWRERPPRLVRMVYGGSLAPGCTDLEGLWEERDAVAWSLAPVPGITTRTGRIDYRRRLSTASADGPLRLLIGGVDEGDIAALDGSEIGRTAADTAALSWTRERRYDFSSPAAGEHELALTVANAAGYGGIWRGPCVLGPPSALAASPQADGWRRATARGRAIHHWCPDEWSHPLRERFTLSLTSVDRTREIVPENVTTGGRFLLPPYVGVIDGEAGWWAIGTLDLPRSEDGLRIEWRDGRLACPFLLAADPVEAAAGWTRGPRLALLPARSRGDALRAYMAALPPRQRRTRQPWWSGPEYCTWGDQCYAAQTGGSDVGGLTDSRVRAWLTALDASGIAAPLVTLDAGWWMLSRGLIDELHRAGRRVVLWTQPYWLPDTTRGSDRAMHDTAGRPIMYDPANWVQDYSIPAVRSAMAAAIRSYLGRAEWNADGIKLDFPYTASPVWAVHDDPTWGAGEQYRARTLQWWYARVKDARANALVTLGCANPLFGAVQDVCRVNEDWVGDPELFRRRAEAILALGEAANCDDWNAYSGYLETQACERPVWGTLTLMSALWRGDARNARKPIGEAWTRRLAAIARLARCAPTLTGQRIRFDRTAGICRRETADGRRVAEALRLDGAREARALLVAAGPDLMATATADGLLTIPAAGRVIDVSAVERGGAARSVPWRALPGGGVRFRITDAAGPYDRFIVRTRR